jgi:hypothetical protein
VVELWFSRKHPPGSAPFGVEIFLILKRIFKPSKIKLIFKHSNKKNLVFPKQMCVNLEIGS